jgi:hypothetical protein
LFDETHCSRHDNIKHHPSGLNHMFYCNIKATNVLVWLQFMAIASSRPFPSNFG